MIDPPKRKIVVVISASTEWQVVRSLFPNAVAESSPLGDWFVASLTIGERSEPVLFFHGGWGKIAAAASAQYAIDRWSPRLLINLGTCGGFEGQIERGALVLAERTLVYDIIEQMYDADAAIAHYTTTLDLSWLEEPYPHAVHRTLLISADRDLVVEEIPSLQARYQAIAGDWESGAIAYVAARNHVRCLILRGVTDLVGSSGGQAYNGQAAVFLNGTRQVMTRLIQALPAWIAKAAISSD